MKTPHVGLIKEKVRNKVRIGTEEMMSFKLGDIVVKEKDGTVHKITSIKTEQFISGSIGIETLVEYRLNFGQLVSEEEIKKLECGGNDENKNI